MTTSPTVPLVLPLSWQQRLTSTFLQLADLLALDFDITEFLQVLLERAVDLLAAEDGGLMLATDTTVPSPGTPDPATPGTAAPGTGVFGTRAPGTGGLDLMALSSEDESLSRLFVVQISDGPCLECFRSGEAILNVDPEGMLQRWSRFGPLAVSHGYSYLHAFPVRYRGRTLGALNLLCLDRSPFSPDGVALGQALADMAAIGLMQLGGQKERPVPADQLRRALAARVVVQQAKGVIAQTRGVSLTEAFAIMRDDARRSGEPLVDVASRLVLHRTPR